jgi:hypothetical protein
MRERAKIHAILTNTGTTSLIDDREKTYAELECVCLILAHTLALDL